MKIAAFGCDNDLMQRIESAAGALDLQAVRLESGSLAEIDGDWEILFLGPGVEQDQLLPLIARLHEENPRGVMIVLLAARTSPEALVEAGAFDILADDASPAELSWSLTRAAHAFLRAERLMNAEKLQAITQLAAGVNHEINNPLTGIMGTAELILIENKQLPEKVQRDLKTIIAQSRRIQMVTLRLKDLDHLRTVPYDHRESMIDLSGGEDSAPVIERRDEREAAIFTMPRLLVVDDNQLVIDLIERLLGARFAIDHATCASDALGKLQFTDYELLLVDLIMPEMDGLELLRAIRRMKPRQRVFITSAFQSNERVDRCLAEGAVGFIKKPFDFTDLERRLWDAVKTENRATPPHRA